MSRRSIASLLGIATAVMVVAGCSYDIKLDPGSDDSLVSINGNPQGRGQVDYSVPSEYGWPDQFEVKVEPKEGQPYTIQVARQLDAPRAIIETAVSIGVGAALVASDALSGSPGVDYFPGLICLAYAPLSWLDSYHYLPYYDLRKLAASQDPQQSLGPDPFKGHLSQGLADLEISTNP